MGGRTGVTHLAVWLGNYLTGVLREKTAVLEWNNSQSLLEMRRFCLSDTSNEKPYQVLDVDYYEAVGAKELAACMGGDYHRIVVDFGTISGERMWECARCDRKIVVGALSEWQAKGFLEFMEKEDKRDKSWCYAITFGSEETRREVEKTFGQKLLRIPVSVDAFVVTRTDMDFFAILLQE